MAAERALIAEWQRSWDTRGVVARTADDGLWLACGVPKREILQVSLEGSGRAAHPIVIPWEELGLEVALSSPVAAVPVGRVAGVVIDSLRRGAAWANAQLRVIGGPPAGGERLFRTLCPRWPAGRTPSDRGLGR